MPLPVVARPGVVTVNESNFPRRRDGLKSTLLPDGYLVVVDESTEFAVTLNPLGSVIWEFCDGLHSTIDIVEELKELGAGESQEVLSAVDSLVSELRASGLLV